MISDKEYDAFYIDVILNIKLEGTHLNFSLLKIIIISSLFFLGSSYFFHKSLVTVNNTSNNTNVHSNINTHTGYMDG